MTRRAPVTTGLPPAETCGHCTGRVRWMATTATRIKVNADPDRTRGNIRWLPGEQVCVQLGPRAAAAVRAEGVVPLYVFHGVDCEDTRRRSNTNRRRAERRKPTARPETRASVMDRLAEQLGWRR